MKLFPFLILALSIAACSKNNDADPLPTAVDTLNTGWKKLGFPISGQVLDIFFINNSTGYAVADSSVFRTIDGGNNWQKVYRSAMRLTNIGMGNTNNAIFTSGSSKVYFTKDGGNSFDSLEIAGQKFDDVFFVNASTAYVAGTKTWKTTNGGSNFIELSSFNPPSGFNSLNSLYFLNEQAGWVTDNGLSKTTNGGITWSPIPGTTGEAFGGMGNVFFPSVNTGFVTDNTLVRKTSDSGSNFTQVYSSSGRSSYKDVHFINEQTGYITDHNSILKTTDGGKTWSKEVVLQKGELIELHFTDVSHGWASGSRGLVLIYQR